MLHLHEIYGLHFPSRPLVGPLVTSFLFSALLVSFSIATNPLHPCFQDRRLHHSFLLLSTITSIQLSPTAVNTTTTIITTTIAFCYPPQGRTGSEIRTPMTLHHNQHPTITNHRLHHHQHHSFLLPSTATSLQPSPTTVTTGILQHESC